MIKNFANTNTENTCTALLIGQRINVKSIPDLKSTISRAYLLEIGQNGKAYIFRYGAVVFFNVDPQTINNVLENSIYPYVSGVLTAPEKEETIIQLDPSLINDNVSFNKIILKKYTQEHFEIMADILAKSLILGHYEQKISYIFDKIDPIVSHLQHKGRPQRKYIKKYLQHIGEVLNIQRNMVGQVEVSDKPETLWNQPAAMTLFFSLLEDEYEIMERNNALKEKLEVIHRSAETMTDILHSKQSLHLEWYIVLLIVFDIALHIAEKYFGL